MNLEKRQNWIIEAIMLDRLVQQMTTKETSAREFRVQNAKLQRMLSKNTPRPYQAAAEALFGGPSKKERKRRGQAIAEIGQQRKKVRRLLFAVMSEFLNNHSKQPLKRVQIQQAVRGLDTAIASLAPKMIAEASKIARRPTSTSPPRLGA